MSYFIQLTYDWLYFQTKSDVLGPSEATVGTPNMHVVNFFDTGIAGSVYPDSSTALEILSMFLLE